MLPMFDGTHAGDRVDMAHLPPAAKVRAFLLLAKEEYAETPVMTSRYKKVDLIMLSLVDDHKSIVVSGTTVLLHRGMKSLSIFCCSVRTG